MLEINGMGIEQDFDYRPDCLRVLDLPYAHERSPVRLPERETPARRGPPLVEVAFVLCGPEGRRSHPHPFTGLDGTSTGSFDVTNSDDRVGAHAGPGWPTRPSP